jgi:NAD(P)-dependent dehydrogenase (short-subunit alcohol dehydrogenase family)
MPSAPDVRHHTRLGPQVTSLTGPVLVTATPMTSSLLASSPEYARHIEAVQPLKGVGAAADVARIAVMLASDDVGWVTGIAMAVDGGFLCQ